jgi:glycerol transport system ATP-binding protein
MLGGRTIETANMAGEGASRTEIGIRPEFVSFSDDGLEAKILRVSDAGRFRIVSAQCAAGPIKILAKEGTAIPADAARLQFDPANTRIYADGWLAGSEPDR